MALSEQTDLGAKAHDDRWLEPPLEPPPMRPTRPANRPRERMYILTMANTYDFVAEALEDDYLWHTFSSTWDYGESSDDEADVNLDIALTIVRHALNNIVCAK